MECSCTQEMIMNCTARTFTLSLSLSQPRQCSVCFVFRSYNHEVQLHARLAEPHLEVQRQLDSSEDGRSCAISVPQSHSNANVDYTGSGVFFLQWNGRMVSAGAHSSIFPVRMAARSGSDGGGITPIASPADFYSSRQGIRCETLEPWQI